MLFGSLFFWQLILFFICSFRGNKNSRFTRFLYFDNSRLVKYYEIYNVSIKKKANKYVNNSVFKSVLLIRCFKEEKKPCLGLSTVRDLILIPCQKGCSEPLVRGRVKSQVSGKFLYIKHCILFLRFKTF